MPNAVKCWLYSGLFQAKTPSWGTERKETDEKDKAFMGEGGKVLYIDELGAVAVELAVILAAEALGD